MAQSFVFIGNTKVGKALAQNMVTAGFTTAQDIKHADIVLTFCTSQDSLEDVYFGTNGVIAAARKGTIAVDLGPASPSLEKEISTMAQVSDLHFTEAPLYVRDVTLPDAFAEKQNLVALVAGETVDVEAADAVLSALAGAREQCGETGRGQLAKCALTMQQALQIVSCMESDALCRAVAGPDAAAEADARAVSLHAATPAQEKLFHAVANNSFSSTYTVEVMMAELEAAMAAADDVDLIVPQTEAASYLFQLLATIGGVDMGPAALTLAYRNEEETKHFGLDWDRADEAYASLGGGEEAAHHHHHHDHDEEDDEDNDDFGDLFGGGLGGYSAN